MRKRTYTDKNFHLILVSHNRYDVKLYYLRRYKNGGKMAAYVQFCPFSRSAGYHATVLHTFTRVVGQQQKFKIVVESCSSCAVCTCDYYLQIRRWTWQCVRPTTSSPALKKIWKRLALLSSNVSLLKPIQKCVERVDVWSVHTSELTVVALVDLLKFIADLSVGIMISGGIMIMDVIPDLL